jgi:glycosyltransferase involved in cell wall biosynthesis
MNIGIVTSFYNGYEKFLTRWASSICKLKIKPSMVVFVQSGKADKDIIIKVKIMFSKHNIKYRFVEIKEHKGMGYARNKAVKNCDTKWIMYLDVDDIVVETALNNLDKYELKTDVICGGLLIKNINGTETKKYFLSAKRKKVLKGMWCCCSHAIYRRKFWEKSPYIEINDFIDYPLWLGFAQFGARFLGVEKLLTMYMRRKDGHHLSMSKKDIVEMKKQKNNFIKYGVNSKCLKRK